MTDLFDLLEVSPDSGYERPKVRKPKKTKRTSPLPGVTSGKVEIHCGNALDVLRTLPSESVQCCITSPPYWGLRQYLPKDSTQKNLEIGAEKTPEEYVSHLVEVFHEVRRILRNDGTLFLVLGDTYTSGNRTWRAPCRNGMRSEANAVRMDHRPETPHGLKPKDLVGIPWMVALALRADGWYLRSDIIFSKPNPMPESVTDRPTRAHEYVFLLTKAAHYYYDAKAIETDSVRGAAGSFFNKGKTAVHQLGRSSGAERVESGKRNCRSVWTIPVANFKGAHFAVFPEALVEPCLLAGTSERGCCPSACGAPWARGPEWFPTCACDGVDRRLVASPTGERIGPDPSIWTGRAGMNRPRGPNEGQRPITRYEQAQYAAQLRASPNRTEMEADAGEAFAHYVRTDDSGARPIPASLLDAWIERGWLQRVVVPEARTDLVPVPCTVLDPFAGSGTTGAVAQRYGRDSILIELNPDYIEIAKTRVTDPVVVGLPEQEEVDSCTT